MQTDLADRGLVIAGVTRAAKRDAEAFLFEYGLNYPVVAEAGAVFDAYGVRATWGSVVYLIDENDRIVAKGFEEIRAKLSP